MIEGTCHCGAVRWTFDLTPDSATTCNCTICRRYGVLWAYDLQGDRTRFSGATRSYVRTSNTQYEPSVAFHFCVDCGCVTHYRALKADPQGRIRTAVNLRMAEPDVVAQLPSSIGKACKPLPVSAKTDGALRICGSRKTPQPDVKLHQGRALGLDTMPDAAGRRGRTGSGRALTGRAPSPYATSTANVAPWRNW